MLVLACTTYLPVAEEEPTATPERGAAGARAKAGSARADAASSQTAASMSAAAPPMSADEEAAGAVPSADDTMGSDGQEPTSTCGLSFLPDHGNTPVYGSGTATLTLSDGSTQMLETGTCVIVHDVTGAVDRFQGTFVLPDDKKPTAIDVIVEDFAGDGMYSGRLHYPSLGSYISTNGDVMLTDAGRRGIATSDADATGDWAQVEFDCGADAQLDTSPTPPFEALKPGLNEAVMHDEYGAVYRFVDIACTSVLVTDKLLVAGPGMVGGSGGYKFSLESENSPTPGTVDAELAFAYYLGETIMQVELTFQCGDVISGTFRDAYDKVEGSFSCANE